MKINAKSLAKFIQVSIAIIYLSLFIIFIIDPYMLTFFIFPAFISVAILVLSHILVLSFEKHLEDYEPKPWNIKKTIFFVIISLILIYQIYRLVVNIVKVGNVNTILSILGHEISGIAFVIFLILSTVFVLFIIKEAINNLINGYLDKKYPELKNEPLIASTLNYKAVKVISYIKAFVILFLIVINFVYGIPVAQRFSIALAFIVAIGLLTAVQAFFSK